MTINTEERRVHEHRRVRGDPRRPHQTVHLIDSALSNITVHGARTTPELLRMSDDMSTH
jgi:hypothetical protein